MYTAVYYRYDPPALLPLRAGTTELKYLRYTKDKSFYSVHIYIGLYMTIRLNLCSL